MDDWGADEDDDFLAGAADEMDKKKSTDDDSMLFDDDDDELLASFIEEEEAAAPIEVKEKADKDDFEELNLTPPTPEQTSFLASNFGHSRFKPLQWRIIKSVTEEKRDQCVVMPTGYGKSLCYQFQPVYEDKVCLVISPLISLMEDQVLGLKSSGISAEFLGSAQANCAKVLQMLEDRELSLLYLTPEYICANSDLLKLRIKDLKTVSAVAIDEAHCVSQWGHDFRPSYRDLSKIKLNFPGVPIIALTATATPQVQKDICQVLKMTNPQITRTSFNRANLYLEVRPKTGAWYDVSQMLEPPINPGDERRFPGPTIIYCPRRKDVELVARELEAHGIKCGMYHAGLSQAARKEAHKAFVYDDIQVVVATIAFGMGIDKPDVRCVIHWGAPRDMESYYQEIGRAGRDGLNSSCRIYFAPADFSTHRHFLVENSDSAWREHRAEMIHQMELFLGYTEKCRRVQLLSHFEPGSTGTSLGLVRARNCCDNCTRHLLKGGKLGISADTPTSEDTEQDFGEDARLLLNALEIVGNQRGLGTSVKVVRGMKDKNIWDRWQQDKVFGAGKGKSVKYWTALGRALISSGHIKEMKHHMGDQGGKRGFAYMGCSISKTGNMLLNSTDPLMLKVVGDLSETKIKPKATVITPRFGMDRTPEDSLRIDLYNMLVSERHKLAVLHSIPPYMVITEQAMLQLAETRPSSLANLKRVQGFSEAKVARYGDDFLKVISKFASQHVNLKRDEFPEELSTDETLQRSGLSQTIITTYLMFVEKKNIDLVAAARGFKVSTLSGHLADCIEAGLELDIELLGVSRKMFSSVSQVIFNPPISSDVSRMSPIKSELENQDLGHVDYGHIRLIVARLKAAHGATPEGVLQWSEDEYKTYQTPDTRVQGGSDTRVQGGSDTRGQGGSDTRVQRGSDTRIQGSSDTRIQGGSDTRIQGGSDSESASLHSSSSSSSNMVHPSSSRDQISNIPTPQPCPENSTGSAEKLKKFAFKPRSPILQDRSNTTLTEPVVDPSNTNEPASSAVQQSKSTGAKTRRLPDWMQDNKLKTEHMRKKMKNNSLFK